MSPVELVAERTSLLDLTHQLVDEFTGRLPAGQVIACVVRCRDVLEASGVRVGLAVATSAMARVRLTDASQGRRPHSAPLEALSV